MVVVMVAVLNRTLLKPINKILEDRDKYILGKVDEAKTILQTSEQKLVNITKLFMTPHRRLPPHRKSSLTSCKREGREGSSI
jgi:hypothetical protein